MKHISKVKSSLIDEVELHNYAIEIVRQKLSGNSSDNLCEQAKEIFKMYPDKYKSPLDVLKHIYGV